MSSPFLRRFNAWPGQLEVCESGGIVLVARALYDDAHEELRSALCLVVDLEGLRAPNAGASATNAMESVLGRWGGEIARQVDAPLANLIWFQIDSLGFFDHVHPIWPPGAQCKGISLLPRHVEWAPLRYPMKHYRSAEAFLGLWGEHARLLLADLSRELASTATPSMWKP